MHPSYDWGVCVEACYTGCMTSHAKKGVNLGGWLVVEKWMTPSLFAGTTASNEYELVKNQKGKLRLRRHHDSFITEADLDWLKAHDIRVVRVPFGYWVFGDQPPYIGAIDRLDWLVQAAGKKGIEVLLDLHGAPGAQNAYAHSGSGNRPRDQRWLDDMQAQQRTIDVLVRIAERYRTAQNVWGIQLLNEPDPGRTGLKLARFYRRAYRAVSKVARPGTRIVFSDGYAPLLLVNALGLIGRRSHPAVMDCHFYQCFSTADKRRTFDDQLRKLRRSQRLIRFLALFQPIIVGEWSAMLPYAVGSEKTWRYWRGQEVAYDKADALFYWNYKTEPAGRWNFRAMVEHKQTVDDETRLVQ